MFIYFFCRRRNSVCMRSMWMTCCLPGGRNDCTLWCREAISTKLWRSVVTYILISKLCLCFVFYYYAREIERERERRGRERERGESVCVCVRVIVMPQQNFYENSKMQRCSGYIRWDIFWPHFIFATFTLINSRWI